MRRISSYLVCVISFNPRYGMQSYGVGTMLLLFVATVAAGQDGSQFQAEIPRVWDERALREMEIPVVVPKYSPKPVTAEYYYKIPVRTIYKSYPVYAPGRAPDGYLEKLQRAEP